MHEARHDVENITAGFTLCRAVFVIAEGTADWGMTADPAVGTGQAVGTDLAVGTGLTEDIVPAGRTGSAGSHRRIARQRGWWRR